MWSHGHSKVMIYLLNRVVDIKIETSFKHPYVVSLFPSLSLYKHLAPSRKCPWPEYPSEQVSWTPCWGSPVASKILIGSSKESGAKGWPGYTHLGDSGKSGREADMAR